MKKVTLLLLGLVFVCSACIQNVKPQKTQLEIREFQTRSYQTKDTKMVMKAMLNVLQDDGFIVKNANTDLGLLTATKEIDVEREVSVVELILVGRPQKYQKNSIIECSANVSEFGKETRVRINFLAKTMNNVGEVMKVAQIEDGNYYQTFFSKVDKGIFIQKEKL